MMYNVFKIRSVKFYKIYLYGGGMRWLKCLGHYVTSRKVAASIPDGVTGIFHWHNPSGRNLALRSTQPLTEMITRNISWGKSGRCVGPTTLSHSYADCLEIWEPSGTLGVWPGLLWGLLFYFLSRVLYRWVRVSYTEINCDMYCEDGVLRRNFF
jgi:hypothetical protein